MKLSSDASMKALRKAQAREQEAVDLYGKCLAEATNESTKVILSMLVDEEKKHFSIVSQLVADAEKDAVPSMKTEKTVPAKETLQKTFGHVSLSGFSAEKTTIDNTLEQALENEKESFNLYSSLAADSEDSETKAVYRYLAEQENRHFIMVSNLLDFLGDPGRWLYEEENLIFRL